MGGGGWYQWLTPQGMIAAGIAHNPDYGKTAADSIAKEIEERGLVAKSASAEEPATGEQVAPVAARTDLSRP